MKLYTFVIPTNVCIFLIFLLSSQINIGLTHFKCEEFGSLWFEANFLRVGDVFALVSYEVLGLLRHFFGMTLKQEPLII